MSPVTHYVLFKTREQYAAAAAILCQPITVELPTAKNWRGKPKMKSHEVILMSATGTHCWPGDGAGQYLWLTEYTEQQAEWWRLIQEALEPLDPYYTDDVQEVVEFYGEA